MSATNKTAVYELPIFLGSDVPSWLTDWNGAMGDIDTAIAAAKAAADAAASTAGTAATDIVTINGQITSLQNTVRTHTTQIGTISGNINTINSLIGNGTPTTTDQTIIGAINELHANQGDLDDLQTTDKSSLVAAINEAAQGGGGSPAASAVSYDNTGSGLTATNVQDAIDEVAASNPSWTYEGSHTGTAAATIPATAKEVYFETAFDPENTGYRTCACVPIAALTANTHGYVLPIYYSGGIGYAKYSYSARSLSLAECATSGDVTATCTTHVYYR